MNKLLLAAPFSLLVGACTPDIADNPPAAAVIAEFDPSTSVVPTPNDLAVSPSTGLVTVPVLTTDTPAQTEFNQDYLGSLRGFPQESTAQVLFSGALDPATVTAANVIVFDASAVAPVPVKLAFDTTLFAIDIAPTAGVWTRGHQYFVATIAGAGHLTGANGTPVVGSAAWGLVTSPQPLVTCPANAATGKPDYTSADCRATVDVIPSTVTDPAARLIDQGHSAAQLEEIRLAYAPVLAELEQIEHVTLAQIPILWTFTIVDAGEVTFDPANSVVPFPNDVLRTGTGGTVSLPNPTTGQPLAAADCAAATDPTVSLYCGLNTLDGFSTIAPPISENGFTTGAVAQANIDPSTLTTTTVGLVPLTSNAPPETRTAPEYAPCLNCLSSAAPDGTLQTLPQQLQWDLFAPLDEKTTYLAYVTGDVKDTNSGANVIANPIFALVRSKNPIFANNKSQVNILSDAQAAQLEPLRAALQPAIEGLVASGLARKNIVLAWAFTTQSEGTLLDQFYAFPGSAADPLPLQQGAVIFADATPLYQGAAQAAMIPAGAIAKFYSGVFETPVTITGPGGTFDPLAPVNQAVTFALAVPASPAPAAGYPITIFGHGLTRDRNDFLAIANSLALAGQATIATDVVFHGERSSCTGSGPAVFTEVGLPPIDDNACADPTTQKCNEDPLFGRCVARDPSTRVACPGLGILGGPDATGNLGCKLLNLGACVEPDGVCEGGDFLRDAGTRPVISGWNIFSLTNFFATRDNFRQQVIDLSQLVRTLHVTGPTSIQTLSGTNFDLTRIGYVGQSLGGILGTLFNAVAPDTKYVALNVPGGDLPQIILQAVSFGPEKAALLGGLALQGIVPGTPAFDQFIATTQWILDPADPANLGYRLTHQIAATATVNAERKAFIQFIQGDETVPNIANLALVAAANRQLPPLPPLGMPPSYGCTGALSCYEFTEAVDGFDTTTAPTNARHSFLLAPPSAQSAALTQKAQVQVATFLATGVGPQ